MKKLSLLWILQHTCQAIKHSLISLLIVSYYFRKILNEENFFEHLKRSSDTGDNFMITFEETFYDYVKRIIRNDQRVFFMVYP